MAFDYRVERWKQPYPPNPAMLRLELTHEGYLAFQWADLPNTIHGSKKNPQAQTHWVVSGNLEIAVERIGRYVLGPGDRGFLPADTYYTLRAIGNEPVVYLVGELKPVVEPAKPKRGRKPNAANPDTKPRKRRMTKTEKAAADAEFEAIKRMFENF